MKVTVKCTSGSYEIEVDKDELVSDLVRKTRERHPRPNWANGVQLKHEGQAEDLVESFEGRTLQEAGIFDGAHLRMEYYKQVSTEEVRHLRMTGIQPNSGKAFLMPKDVQVTPILGIAGL
eukprot:gb/GFBE01055847.1/.p1 GENE.gb/GFBE01055847.1/~~gb/GFBE01055847.1/.p1  ORF type:complete len:120 (+),score=31.69 gb/GFBE01055847.1/:1-360(+)